MWPPMWRICHNLSAFIVLAELPQQAYRLSWQQGQLLWQEAGEDGELRCYSRDPKAGVWRRLQSWLLGWLPLESEL